jgi:hypothetical protein
MGWIILIIVLLVVYRYFLMRMDLEKTTYIRAFLCTCIYDKMFLIMAFLGLGLFIS